MAFDKLIHDIDQRIEAGEEVTPEERYLYHMSGLYPSWTKGGNKVFLANYPIDSQLSDQYLKVYGRDISHEMLTMPGLTLLDTYGMIISMLGGLSAAAVTAGRAATGDEDVTAGDAVKLALQSIVDPTMELASPASEEVLEGLRDAFFGKTFEYNAPYVRLKPTERKLINLLHGGGFISKDEWVVKKAKGKKPDLPGTERMNATALSLFRMSPFFGTQLARTFDPMIDAYDRSEYTNALFHVLRQISGIGKVYTNNPEWRTAGVLYDIKEKGQELSLEEKYEPVLEADEET